MENKIRKELNKIKSYAAVQQLTKPQLEATIDWLIQPIIISTVLCR